MNGLLPITKDIAIELGSLYLKAMYVDENIQHEM